MKTEIEIQPRRKDTALLLIEAAIKHIWTRYPDRHSISPADRRLEKSVERAIA